jgi:hypothetical protein
VIVGAAGHDAVPVARHPCREPLRIRDDLPDVLLERRLKRFPERGGLRGHDVNQGSALKARKHDAVEILRVLGLAQDEPGPRTAERLVRRRRDEIAVRDGARVVPGRHEPGDVGHVRHDLRSDRSRDPPDAREIDDARVRGRAAHDELRLVLARQRLELVVVEGLVGLAYAVGHERVQLAGEVERMAVGQVPSVRQVHPQNGVAGFEHREVDRLVRLAPRMRLHVGMLGAEQLLRAIDRQALNHVRVFAPAVVAFSGVPFSVLVGEDGSRRLEHGVADEILGGDQLESSGLARGLVADGLRHRGVGLAQRPVHRVHGALLSSPLIFSTRVACRPPSNA